MKKLLVKGPALSVSGYGEQCRFALRAMREYEDRFDIFLHNINWGRTGMLAEDTEERTWIEYLIAKTAQYVQQGGTFDISLQVTIPNEWEKIAPINIGYTAGIETTKIAPQWIEPSNMMDKIIVVSEHAKYGFVNTRYPARNQQTGEERMFGIDTPVEVVHYSVRAPEPQALDLQLSTDFNFLSVAQWGPRKNLEATIVSFMEEFYEEENVGLVLKTSIARSCTMDRLSCEQRLERVLATYPDAKCKLYLLHGTMSPEELAGLYAHPKIKAIVSTTHGEGFGLPLFEAACTGLPVVAPNWSGHVDFLYAPVKDKKTGKVRNRPHFTKIDYEIHKIQAQAVWDGVLTADSSWCFAKKGSARNAMREVYTQLDKKVALAKHLKKTIEENFASERIYGQFADHVYEPDTQWEADLDQVVEA